jgi:uncharacterized RDD family membrane protein YckC
MANFTFVHEDDAPDPALYPAAFEGLLWRRVFAYAVDLGFIGALMLFCWVVFTILTLLSLGLLGPALWFVFGLIPLAYHTLQLAGRHSATLGMRCFDIELRSWSGERPLFLQALAQTALFYLTIAATGSLILLVALFNRRKRTLHDFLAGTMAPGAPEPPGRADWSSRRARPPVRRCQR